MADESQSVPVLEVVSGSDEDFEEALRGEQELPEAMPVPNRYWADWAHFSQWQFASGAIARYNFSDGLAVTFCP